PPGFFSEYHSVHAHRWRGQLAPALALQAIEAACDLPLEQGLACEQALFKRAESSPQSAALRHQFFAQRAATRVADVDSDTVQRPIERVAVIGAGTMGAGIAMSLASAG